MINVYLLLIVFSIGFLTAVIMLVRKNKLLESYSLLWIFFGIIMIIFSLTPKFIEGIAELIGIKYAPSVLFVFGGVYLVVYNLHITIVLSKQSNRVIRLTQELALLKQTVANTSTKGSINERKTTN